MAVSSLALQPAADTVLVHVQSGADLSHAVPRRLPLDSGGIAEEFGGGFSVFFYSCVHLLLKR